MTKQKLTEDMKDAVVFYTGNEKTKELTQELMGKMFGVSARTIYRALIERGVITPKASKENNTSKQVSPTLDEPTEANNSLEELPHYIESFIKHSSNKTLSRIYAAIDQRVLYVPTKS